MHKNEDDKDLGMRVEEERILTQASPAQPQPWNLALPELSSVSPGKAM